MKSKIIVLGLLVGFTIGCENHLDNQRLQIESNVDKQEMAMSSQDEIIRNVALTIHEAMIASVDFRETVKQMALEKFDGDYDILLSQIKDKEVFDYAPLKGLPRNVSVAYMFEELYPATDKSSFQEDVLSAISQMYPNMQISVPVNIDKWEEGYIPTVVFIDSSFKDTITEYVQGFDAHGNSVWVDAINAPEMPIVVVGYNERIGGLSDCVESDTRVLPPVGGEIIPISPTLMVSNFTATIEGGIIRLSWESYGSVSSTEVYCSVDGGEFINIGTATNSSFIVNDVDANTTYEFYVKLIGIKGLGSGSASAVSSRVSVTTGQVVLQPLTSFQATQINDTQVMLSWEQNSATNNEYVQIYRRALVDNTETGLGTLIASISNSNTHVFIDEGGFAGNKYLYTAMNAKNGCVSNHKYDTIWKASRNCSRPDSVYLKTISYDADSYKYDIESWLYGAPEFRVSVHTVSGDSTTPSTRVNGKFFYFDEEFQNFKVFNSENYLFSWLPSTTYDSMMIHMTEWDLESADVTVSVNVGVGFKVPLKNDIDMSLSASVGVNINDDDIPIGFGQTYYFESPHPLISLENFDFQVRLSNTNVNN